MKTHETSIAYQLFKRNIGDQKLNISALARDLNICHTNLWFYVNGERKWNLEHWLNAMALTGHLDARQDKIAIKAPLELDEISHFDNLSKKHGEYFFKA